MSVRLEGEIKDAAFTLEGDIRVGLEFTGLSRTGEAITAVLSGINKVDQRSVAPGVRGARGAPEERPCNALSLSRLGGSEYLSKNCHIVSSALTRMMPRPTPARIQFFAGPIFSGLPGQTCLSR